MEQMNLCTHGGLCLWLIPFYFFKNNYHGTNFILYPDCFANNRRTNFKLSGFKTQVKKYGVD